MIVVELYTSGFTRNRETEGAGHMGLSREKTLLLILGMAPACHLVKKIAPPPSHLMTTRSAQSATNAGIFNSLS